MKSTHGFARFQRHGSMLLPMLLPALLIFTLALAPCAAMAAVAGHVQFVAGDVRIIDLAGKQRTAQKGQAIDEGETVVTAAGAAAQLRMIDGGILALRADTQLKVDSYVFNGAANGSENALLSLVKGGLRSITGLIGKTNKEKLKLQTPNAVIGIRGTDHEPVVLLAPQPGAADNAQANPPGTYDKVNVGATTLTTQAGTAVIAANQIGFAGSPTSVPVILPKLPDFYRAAPAPLARAEQKQQGAQSSSSSSSSTSSSGSSTASSSSASTASSQSSSAQAGQPAAADVGTVATTLTAPSAGNLTAVDASGNVLSLANQTVTSASGQTQALSSSTNAALGTASGGSVVMVVYPYNQVSSNPAIPQAPILGGNGLNLSFDASGNLSAIAYKGSGANLSGINLQTSPLGESISFTQSGSSLSDYGSNAATGLSWGRWVGGQVTGSAQYVGQDANGNWGLGANDSSGAFVIGATQNQNFSLGSNSLHWITGSEPPDFLSQILTGTVNYTLIGGTHPTDQFGNVGSLGSASLAVNFSAQTANASVGFTIGGNSWTMQSGAMPLNGPQFSVFTDCSSQCVNGVTVTKNGATTPNFGASGSAGGPPPNGTTLGTMSGQLTGSGLNGAMLQYAVQDFEAPTPGSSNPNSNYNVIQGVAAFSGPAQDANTPFRAVGTTDGWNGFAKNSGGSGGNAVPPTYHGNIEGTEQPAASVVDSAAGLTAFVGQAAGYTPANSSIVVPTLQGPAQFDTIKIGTATNTDLGSASVGGITVSWGRWAGGTVDIYSLDGATLLGSIDNSNRSIHWLTTSVLSSNFNAMPLSGTATYTVVGNTAPTDFKGNVGTLNSATLSADFANAKVNAGISVSFNAASNTSTWNMNVANIPLSGSDFKSDTSLNGANGIVDTVTCSGASCSGQTRGYLEGHFISGAQGAALLYGMAGGTGSTSGSSISSFTPTTGITGLVVMKH